MSASIEVENLEEPEFVWGKRRGVGGKKRDVQFYESFNYDGVEYTLYDCVYMHNRGEPPHIGKLVKVWENADKTKKIKVQWFFRPSEISYYLKDTKVLENELFFASGEGKGLANLNPLEAIAGKCNVVCISTDTRNPPPSAEEIQMASYVFYRIFDVKSLTIIDQIDDTVGGLEVKYVFNRRHSLMPPDVPELDLNGKDEERSVIARKETLELAGKNLLQQLNNVKPDENGDPMLEKENTDVKEVQANQRNLLGESSSSFDVNPSKHIKPTAATVIGKSTLDGENVGCKVSGEKDEVKDRVQVEVRVKSARGSGNLDDTPSNGAKSVDTVPLFDVKETGNDVAHLVTGATSSNAKPKPELVKNPFGSGKDVKLAGNSSVLDEKLPKTSFPLPEETPRSGHIEDAVGLEKDANLSKDFKGLQGQQLKRKPLQSIEKPESARTKDSVGIEMDNKLGEKVNACKEKSSTTKVVSPNDTTRSLTNKVSTNEIPKSGANKDFEGSRQAAKLVKSSSVSMKRPLKTSPDLFEEKSNHKNKDAKFAQDSCPMEGGSSKKARIDASFEALGDSKNNTIKKMKEKTWQGETKNSSTLVTSHDTKAKSTLGDEAMKKVGKLSNNNSLNPLESDGVKVEGQIFEVTQRSNVEKSKWMKLSWEQKLENAREQGKLVLLQNLDPEYSSEEVEDIIWHAFKENCTARMVQHTAISNQHNGQAFVIFKTTEAVDRVVNKLDDGCLMLPNQRPLVVSTGDFPKFSEKQMAFAGHLSIDRARRQIQREMREAVSTPHFSQQNTIEYEMAMSWCLLQSRSDKWWAKLYEQQWKELKKLKDQLKSK